MLVRHYLANGVFWHDTNTSDNKATCQNAVAKNVDVEFNHSYGLFMFGCEGGAFNGSNGWGHGDSAYYIGATPFQKNPQKTVLKNLNCYENVLGYSGTNSKYVVIKDSDFYNNGAGIVPNTLDSEPFEPNGSGVIKDNNIFWNNFNYFLPNSPVKTVSGGLGGAAVNYPTGYRRRPVRLRRLEGREQPDLRQLQVGRRAVLRPARQRGRRRDQPQQPDAEQLDGPGRHRHATVNTTSSPTAPEAATASRATTARRSRPTTALPAESRDESPSSTRTARSRPAPSRTPARPVAASATWTCS